MSGTTPKPAPEKSELRKFGLIFGAGLVLIFGLFFPWLLERPWPAWPFIAAGILAFMALVFPVGLKPLHTGWMKFGHVAGWINTRIILGLVFYTVFLPFGLIMRLFGNDPMKRKLDNESESYRVPSHSSPIDQMERPF
ncbi:MAG: sxtJ [Gammaproteobacteria bacterium]|nr:MAG: sxtJ [Gammaproteobacteria bacterium]